MNMMYFVLNTCIFQSGWLLQVRDLQAISCFVCRDAFAKPLENHAAIVRIHLSSKTVFPHHNPNNQIYTMELSNL